MSAQNVTQLPELGYAGTIDLAVCDVSFTSIANIIDAVLACLAPTGAFCTLVKPQFEAPAALVGEGGIVTDPAVRRDTLVAAVELFAAKGLFPVDVCVSPFMVPRATLSFSCTARDLTPAIARKTSCNPRYRL